MRTATTIGLGAVAVLVGVTWAGAPETPAVNKPLWLTDFAAAQADARRTERPILAVLH